MKESVTEASAILREARELHRNVFQAIVGIKRVFGRRETTLEELIDLCWLLRQTSKLYDDLRKELARQDDTISIVVANRWLMRPTHGPIRGELATGSPDVRDQPCIPRRSDNPEAYDAMLRDLGVPEDVVSSAAIRIDFEGIGNFLAALQQAGKPVPAFLKKAGESYTKATLRLTTKRGNPFDSEGSKNDSVTNDRKNENDNEV